MFSSLESFFLLQRQLRQWIKLFLYQPYLFHWYRFLPSKWLVLARSSALVNCQEGSNSSSTMDCGECKTNSGRHIICCDEERDRYWVCIFGFSGVQFSSALGLLSELLEDGELLERERWPRYILNSQTETWARNSEIKCKTRKWRRAEGKHEVIATRSSVTSVFVGQYQMWKPVACATLEHDIRVVSTEQQDMTNMI